MVKFKIIKTKSHERFHSFIINFNNNNIPNIFNEYKNYYKKNNLEINYTWGNDFLGLYFMWIYNCVKNKYISIRNPFTNTIMESNTYFLHSFINNSTTHTLVANYYFDQEFIVGLGLGTTLGALETRVLYIICLKSKNVLYDWWEFNRYTFLKNLPIIFYKLNIFKNNNCYKNLIPKVSTLFGFMNNIGHIIFNEMTGLFLLDIQDVNMNIDEVFIGSFDIFFTKDYFKKYPNLNLNDEYKDDKNLQNYQGRGFIFKYNHIFLSSECKLFLKYNLKMQINNSTINNLDEIKNIKNHNPIFMIYLRNNRTILNQETVLASLVNKLTYKFPNAYFLFSGFCSNPSLSEQSIIGHKQDELLTVEECIKNYNSIYDSIISKIKTTTNFKSIINFNTFELAEYIDISNYTIYQNNNLATLSSWLFTKPGIILGIKNENIPMYKNQDLLINENHPNIIFCENTSPEFNINIDKLFRIIVENIKI
jgi:hypothetical protein